MAFNINAHVILQGPKNISAVTKSIRSQLQNINVNVGVNVPRTAQTQINTLNKQLNNLNNTNQKITSSAKSASSSVSSVGTSAKSAANAMQVLGKETALTFKRFAAAGIVTATFFRLTQAISEAVPKALEFERGLTKLQQITGSTRRGLDGLAKTVDGLAKSFGKDANEILEIAQIFAQTGQSIRQVEASVRAVAKSSLAPTFGDMKQTAEGLVAALNQFGISARDSERVLGSLNRVSKKFAVESDDLIAAIRRAGGVFAISAGQFKEPIDALNEFSAIFTAVRSTTRETAETVATGLRTIFSRIQRRGTIEVLRGLGIELTDTNGKFKGLFESFRILSKELDGLVQRGDAITLSAITEELGGIRQIGKLIPAIRNFNKAERAFAEAAQGASEGLGKDVAKGLEPLIVQFERVQQRFNSLVRTISDSSTFQALAKSAIGIANAFLSITESLTPILPLLAKFAAFKLSKGAASFFQGFFGSARGAGGAAAVGQNLGRVATGQGRGGGAATSSLASAIKSMNTAVGGLSKVTSANTAATNSLNTTIKALQGSVGALNSTIRAKGFGGGIGSVVRGRGGRPRGFASGGLVPGTGNYDTVPAMLTPGEFVIKKSSVNSIGAGNLANINKYAAGGKVIGSVGGTFGLGALGGIKGRKSLANEARTLAQIESEGSAAAGVLRNEFKSMADLQNAKGVSLGGKLGTFRQSLSKEEKGLYDAIKSKSIGSGALSGSGKVAAPLRKKLAKLTGVTQKEIAGLNQADAATFLNQKNVADARVALGAGISTYDEARAESARLVAKGGRAYGLESGARKTFGRKIVGKIPGIIASASAGMGKEFEYEASTPLSSVLDTGGLNSLNGLLFEAFVKSASRDIAGGEQNAAFDIMAGDVGKLSTLFSGYRNPTELKNLFADKQINSTYNKAVRSFGVSFDPAAIATFAKGGMASGTDTVPAMLTPGEFVINRKSAQSIGYGNLKTMNSGGSVPNGVKGYAAGGIVEEGRQFYGRVSPETIKRIKARYPDLNISTAEAKKIAGMNANQLRKFENSRRIASTATVSQGNIQSTKPKVQGIVPASTTGQVQPQQATRGNLRNQPRRLTSPRGTAAGFAAMRMSSSNQLSAGVPAPGSAAAITKQNQQVVKTNTQQTTAIKKNTVAVQKAAKSQARGQGLLSAAFFLPDLLFSIPLLAESFKDVSEGVEGAGSQLASTLLSTGISAAFLIPAFKEMGGLKGAVKGVKGGLSSLSKGVFGAGRQFKSLRTVGAPGTGAFGRTPAPLGRAAAFRNIGGGNLAKGFAKVLTPAAIAGTIATIVVGPITESIGKSISTAFTGVKFEEIGGITGSRGESLGMAQVRGGAAGAVTGAVGGAVTGAAFGLPGAIIGGLLGGALGGVTGVLEAELNKVKFDNLASLSDAAGEAAKSLSDLANKQVITGNDVSVANQKTSRLLNIFRSTIDGNIQAQKEYNGTIAGFFSNFGGMASRGFRNFFDEAVEGGSNIRTERAANERTDRALAGETGKAIAGALAAGITDDLVKSSEEAFQSVAGSLLSQLSEGSGAEGRRDLGRVSQSIDLSSFKDAQDSIFKVQDALRKTGTVTRDAAGNITTFGNEVADAFAQNLQIQFLSQMKSVADTLGDDGNAFLGALSEFTNPEVFKNAESFASAQQRASSRLNQLFGTSGTKATQMQRALKSLTSTLTTTQLEALKADIALAQYNVRLKQSQSAIEAIVSPLAKLTSVYEQAASEFDRIIGNAKSTLDSAIAGTANFELADVDNPFENLDLNVAAEDFAERVRTGFEQIQTIGGAPAAQITSGLEGAPEFAAGFEQFLKDSVLQVDRLQKDRGGQLPTIKEVLGVFEQGIADSSIGGGELANLVLKDIETALIGTSGRQGTDQIPIEAVTKALNEDGNLLSKFGENVEEIIGELSKLQKASVELVQNQLDIVALQRQVQVATRDLVQKNRDIDKRVGEITGDRTGTFAEADKDLRDRISLLSPGAGGTDAASLAAEQTSLRQQLQDARARQNSEVIDPALARQIGELEVRLADNTDAVKTLADDTSRLAAIQSQIERLQSQERNARQGGQAIFSRFADAQAAFRRGDTEQGAQILRGIREEMRIVNKLQTGAALDMGEGARFLGGELNSTLALFGATPEQIEQGLDRGFLQVPRVLTDAFQRIGINVDPRALMGALNRGGEIEGLRGQARLVGGEQKASNDILRQDIKQAADVVFQELSNATVDLENKIRSATTAVETFKNTILEGSEPAASTLDPELQFKIDQAREAISKTEGRIAKAEEEMGSFREMRDKALLGDSSSLMNLLFTGTSAGIFNANTGEGIPLLEGKTAADLQGMPPETMGDIIDVRGVIEKLTPVIEAQISSNLETGEKSTLAEERALLKQQNELLKELIKQATTTSGVLQAEQGPNSFNVFDKTADKNAADASNKLSAIQKSNLDSPAARDTRNRLAQERLEQMDTFKGISTAKFNVKQLSDDEVRSLVSDEELRTRLLSRMTPEGRATQLSNEALAANMVTGGRFAGSQGSNLQSMVDAMRKDPDLSLSEINAAEAMFIDKASRQGIVSGRVGDQSRAAITNRQLEGVQEAFDANQQRRSANEQRPFDIIAAERRERMAAEAAREENMRNIPLEDIAGEGFGAFDKVLADFGVESDQGLFKAIQEGRTSFGRFGTEEQEFSGLRGGATSRATTLKDQAIFLQDLFTREAAGGEKVDFDLLTADAIGIDPSLDPKKRKAALDKLNREEQNKRLSKITAAPGTAEFESQYEDIAGGGFFAGRNFLTKSQREQAESQLRREFSNFDRRVTYNDEINDEALGGPSSDQFHEARRKQFAGTKAAAIARKGGAKVEAAAPVEATSGFGSAREDYLKFREEEDAYNARLNEMHAATQAADNADIEVKRAQAEVSLLDEFLDTDYSSEGMIDRKKVKEYIRFSKEQGTTENVARYQDVLDTKSGKEQRQKILKMREEQKQRLQQLQEEQQAAQQGLNQAQQNLGERPTRPTAPSADAPLQTEFPPDPGKATSMGSSAYETEQKAQAGLLAGVPGARGNFRQFGTGVRGRGSVDPQNYISGAAKKSIMRGKSFVTRAGSMGQYMDPRTGKTFNYDELSASARKSIQLGTSKLVKKPTVKPETKGAGGVAGGGITPEKTSDIIGSGGGTVGSIKDAAAMHDEFMAIGGRPSGAAYEEYRDKYPIRKTPLGPVDEHGMIPGKNYGPQGSRPGGMPTLEEMGFSSADLHAAMGITNSHVGYGGPTGSRPKDFLNAVGFSPASAASALTGVGGGYTPAPMPMPGGMPIPQGAGGLGGVGGIMGPDAVQAISSLAGALNNLGGVIELKITEPIEVRLDQGNLMGEIKKVVAEAVKNSASSALAGNGSQMTPSTTTSPTPN